MRNGLTLFATSVVGVLLLSPAARAEDLINLLPNLYPAEIRLLPNVDPARSHDTHFVDSSSSLRATGEAVNQSIGQQLSTFPLASSSGGFTYEYDEALGGFKRTTDSFGPIFAERVNTIGKGKFNFGVSYLHASYKSIDGIDLNHDIEFQLTHADTNRDGTTTNLFFEGDVIDVRTEIELKTDTTVFSANYGLLKRLDVALAVPIVHVDLQAQGSAVLDRLATGDNPATSGIHRFPGDDPNGNAFANEGTASGVGDVLLHAKYDVKEWDQMGMAVALDVRLPTGDEKNLLGTGATAVRPSVILGTRFGKFSPHLNLGYTFQSSPDDNVLGDIPDELDYTFGFDWAAHAKATIAADFLGRWIKDGTRLEAESDTFQFEPLGDAEPETIVLPARIVALTENRSLALLALGAKLNIYRNLLVTGNVLIPLNDNGLKASAIPLVGADYTF